MFFTFLIVVILTAVALVVLAMTVANLIGPKSYNKQKAEPYECGIPTRGRSWVQFRVGYYLFAILFLIFDIETVFLFPWAVVVQEVGAYGLISIAFFLLVLILGLAYAWRKGRPKRRARRGQLRHLCLSLRGKHRQGRVFFPGYLRRAAAGQPHLHDYHR